MVGDYCPGNHVTLQTSQPRPHLSLLRSDKKVMMMSVLSALEASEAAASDTSSADETA